jgi:hypothetical protein
MIHSMMIGDDDVAAAMAATAPVNLILNYDPGSALGLESVATQQDSALPGGVSAAAHHHSLHRELSLAEQVEAALPRFARIIAASNRANASSSLLSPTPIELDVLSFLDVAADPGEPDVFTVDIPLDTDCGGWQAPTLFLAEL